MRAFADWMIDVLNEKAALNAGVAVVQPINNGLVDLLEKQQGLYHLIMRGLSNEQVVNEKRLISCIQQTVNPFTDPDTFFQLAKGEDLQLILSNTTEAGIEFDPRDLPADGELARTFPGKLTQLLYARYQFFEGDESSGLGILPCELIDRNGVKLKQAILQYASLWDLPAGFAHWIRESNYFANTLVDRIVPGYPAEEIEQIKSELGFEDRLVVASELFHLWVIEGPSELQDLFPAHRYGLNVKYVSDQSPYRTRKVRILNGPHTSMVAVGMLTGIETVKETIENQVIGPFIKELIFEEIIPTIDMPEEALNNFAHEIIERFRNPFIRHELKSISLNSISKFKVRVLPSILDYIDQRNEAPARLCTVFASLIKLYYLVAQGKLTITDDPKHLEFFSSVANHGEIPGQIRKVLSNSEMWGQDLSGNGQLLQAVTAAYYKLDSTSVDQSIQTLTIS